MKRYKQLLITGVACMGFAGMFPVWAQDATKNTNPSPSATPTPAQKPSATDADKSDRPEMTLEQKRMEIDKIAKSTMDMLLAKSTNAKQLYDKAYAYAVFDNLKLAFLISGEGGKGVAVAKSDMKKRTYMNMGSAGVGIGLGAHKYQVVFLFETKERFEQFVHEGWTANASASAVAGEAGKNAEASFQNGIALYQITDAGLMLNADVSGTKFWRDDELNAGIAQHDDSHGRTNK